MEHTPGPWENHKWNSDEHQISALGGTVALVSHSHSLISDEQADANARLIAAAPELLEACNWFDTDRVPTDKGFDEWFQDARKYARAAIAKATTV
jgi:hypothetical protein